MGSGLGVLRLAVFLYLIYQFTNYIYDGNKWE